MSLVPELPDATPIFPPAALPVQSVGSAPPRGALRGYFGAPYFPSRKFVGPLAVPLNQELGLHPRRIHDQLLGGRPVLDVLGLIPDQLIPELLHIAQTDRTWRRPTTPDREQRWVLDETVEPLARAAAGYNSLMIRAAAAPLLTELHSEGRIEEDTAEAVIESLTHSRNPTHRAAAASALAEYRFADRIIIPAWVARTLHGLREDPDVKVKFAAHYSLLALAEGALRRVFDTPEAYGEAIVSAACLAVRECHSHPRDALRLAEAICRSRDSGFSSPPGLIRTIEIYSGRHHGDAVVSELGASDQKWESPVTAFYRTMNSGDTSFDEPPTLDPIEHWNRLIVEQAPILQATFRALVVLDAYAAFTHNRSLRNHLAASRSILDGIVATRQNLIGEGPDLFVVEPIWKSATAHLLRAHRAIEAVQTWKLFGDKTGVSSLLGMSPTSCVHIRLAQTPADRSIVLWQRDGKASPGLEIGPWLLEPLVALALERARLDGFAQTH